MMDTVASWQRRSHLYHHCRHCRHRRVPFRPDVIFIHRPTSKNGKLPQRQAEHQNNHSFVYTDNSTKFSFVVVCFSRKRLMAHEVGETCRSQISVNNNVFHMKKGIATRMPTIQIQVGNPKRQNGSETTAYNAPNLSTFVVCLRVRAACVAHIVVALFAVVAVVVLLLLHPKPSKPQSLVWNGACASMNLCGSATVIDPTTPVPVPAVSSSSSSLEGTRTPTRPRGVAPLGHALPSTPQSLTQSPSLLNPITDDDWQQSSNRHWTSGVLCPDLKTDKREERLLERIKKGYKLVRERDREREEWREGRCWHPERVSLTLWGWPSR